MVPRALNQMAGTKFKIVTGYQGSVDMYLAMERGETHGMATGVWFDLTRERADWVKDHKVAVLFQISTTRTADLPNVPRMIDLAGNIDVRTVFELISITGEIGRPLLTAPGVPPGLAHHEIAQPRTAG